MCGKITGQGRGYGRARVAVKPSHLVAVMITKPLLILPYFSGPFPCTIFITMQLLKEH